MIPVKEIPNFVQCDARFLPFKNACFDTVLCFQVIEHMEKPEVLFRELVRVSKETIHVETSHRFGEATTLNRETRKWFREHHVSPMNFTYLKKLGEACGCITVRTYVISWRGFPHNYMPIFRFPCGIGIEYKKVKRFLTKYARKIV